MMRPGFWSRWWRRARAPACVIDGERLLDAPSHVRRLPLAWLAGLPARGGAGAVVLIDHAHPQAGEALAEVQRAHPEHLAVGAIVFGVENARTEVLADYRRSARAPLFDVDLRRPADLLLLADALVASRVAARLLRPAGARAA